MLWTLYLSLDKRPRRNSCKLLKSASYIHLSSEFFTYKTKNMFQTWNMERCTEQHHGAYHQFEFPSVYTLLKRECYLHSLLLFKASYHWRSDFFFFWTMKDRALDIVDLPVCFFSSPGRQLTLRKQKSYFSLQRCADSDVRHKLLPCSVLLK